MKKWSSGKLKLLRNIIIIAAILIGLILWFFMPDTFANNSLFHVGNGEMGSKYGALLILLIPLFALIPCSNEEIHSDDEQQRKKLEEEKLRENYECQVFLATGLALTVVLIMVSCVLFL